MKYRADQVADLVGEANSDTGVIFTQFLLWIGAADGWSCLERVGAADGVHLVLRW